MLNVTITHITLVLHLQSLFILMLNRFLVYSYHDLVLCEWNKYCGVVLGTKHGLDGCVDSGPRVSEVIQWPGAEGPRALGDFWSLGAWINSCWQQFLAGLMWTKTVVHFYRPRSEGDNVLGSVCLSVRLSVCVCVCLSELSCLNRQIWSKVWSLPVRGFCLFVCSQWGMCG